MTKNYSSITSSKSITILFVVIILTTSIFLLLQERGDEGEEKSLKFPALVQQVVPRIDQHFSDPEDASAKPLEVIKTTDANVSVSEEKSVEFDAQSQTTSAPLTVRKSPVEGGGLIIDLDDRHLHR